MIKIIYKYSYSFKLIFHDMQLLFTPDTVYRFYLINLS